MASTSSPLEAPIDARRGRPDLSLMFFSADSDAASFDFVMKATKFADDARFKAVWFPERHFDRFGGPFPNPALFCAAAARITKTIRLRAGSVVLPLHDMVRIYEDWAVVDNLSGGRVDLAFATGWDARSFCLKPENYASRGDIVRDGVEQFRALWSGASTSRVNGEGVRTSITPLPRPVQSRPDLWLTAVKQPAIFEQAGRSECNVLTALLMQPLEKLSENMRLYRAARAGAKSNAARGKVTLMLHTFVGTDDGDALAKVAVPLTSYLASSMQLWGNESDALRKLSEQDRARIIEFALQRYVRMSSLIGGPETVARRLSEITRLGIDEIACLIDFGPAVADVMASLVRLAAIWKEMDLAERTSEA